MPIEVVPPRAGLSPFYRGRGTHLGVYVDRSTKARTRALALKVIAKWEREIERDEFAQPSDPTFSSAAVSYMQAGGDARPLTPLIDYFKDRLAKTIKQPDIDACAAALRPDDAAPTRNREIYTPVSAVLKHAGFDFKIRRPKGWRSRPVYRWLWPDQAERVIEGAYAIDAELGCLCVMFLYGGLRLSEQLKMMCDEVRLVERYAFVPDSKTKEPQPMHLTAAMVEALKAHPRGLERHGERLFRWHKGGGLYWDLKRACMIASGLEPAKRVGRGSKFPKLPPFEFDWVKFHTFRRSYANWMQRFGGLDDRKLLDTKRWKSLEAVEHYRQTLVHENAMAADLLPVPARLIASQREALQEAADEAAQEVKKSSQNSV
jgi:hypothetical protein